MCLCCWVDAVTCGASKPDALWYYSIKYDDGEEEHKVGPARIFPNNNEHRDAVAGPDTLVVPALNFAPSLPRGSATRRPPAMH